MKDDLEFEVSFDDILSDFTSEKETASELPEELFLEEKFAALPEEERDAAEEFLPESDASAPEEEEIFPDDLFPESEDAAPDSGAEEENRTEKNSGHAKDPLSRAKKLLFTFAGILSAAASVLILGWMLVNVHPGAVIVGKEPSSRPKADIVSQLGIYAANMKANSLRNVAEIKKQYRIPEGDLVAPKPDPLGYGMTNNTGVVMDVIEKARASGLLEGQDVIFSKDVEFYKDTPIQYYYDETLLVICWKELLEGRVCSCCEVKMADASQLRRKLSEDTYGSPVKAYATELAKQTNAVAAINADLYLQRDLGITVYNREVYRFGEWIYTGRYNQYNAVDNLLIDADGNFNFLLMGTQTTKEDVQKYVDENDILFSVAFGPILVREGELQQYDWYPVGEIEKEYSRAGLAQCDNCHYFYMTVSNSEYEYTPLCTINQFAELMFSKGVKNAYALDGGQTAELVFDGEPFNHIDYGAERSVSDIIYFASALGKAEVTVK